MYTYKFDDDDDDDDVSKRRHFFVTCDFDVFFEILKIYAIRKSVDLSQDEELNILNTELDGCRTLRFLFFGAQMCELLSQQNPTVSSVSTDHQVNYASSPVEDLIYFPSNAVPARAPLIEVVGFSVQNLGMCPVLFDALLFLSICV